MISLKLDVLNLLLPVGRFHIVILIRYCHQFVLKACKVRTRLGSSPSQEKSRERRTWDIRSISNVTCKNWRENLLLFSTGKPRLRRKNPTVKFGALAGYPSPSLPILFSHIFALFFTVCVHRYFQPLERRT